MALFLRRYLSTNRLVNRDLPLKPMKFLRQREVVNQLKLSKVKEIIISENIETKGNIDWKQVVNKLSQQKLVNQINFESDLMSAFLLEEENNMKIDRRLFESMNDFIKGIPNVSNNSIAASRYCHFISHFSDYITESDIEMIRRVVDQMMAKYLDNRMTLEIVSPCLKGLAKSSKDNCLHSIKLLDQIKTLDYNLYQNIIDSAIDYNLINEIIILTEKCPQLRLEKSVINKLIEKLSQTQPSLDQIIKLFNHLSRTLVVFDDHLRPKLMQILKRFSYKISRTAIGHKNCLCRECSQTLESFPPEEQNSLLKDFVSVVFDKQNDIIMKSFPEFEEELDFFNSFMEKIRSRRGPLDLVIDGLNIAFCMNPIIVEDNNNLRKYRQKYPIDMIDTNVVEFILNNDIEKYSNVLIVGRKHMKEKKWKNLKYLLERHSDRISMFYTMNKNQDDCYTLYAALQNPNTYLISNDFYRNYCKVMSVKNNLFERWLKTHQMLVNKYKRKFEFPNSFEYKINISKHSIHIPFESNQSSTIEWICCQKP